jgi:uncharacterized protein (DUF58 family)
MQYPNVKPPEADRRSVPGVYVDLDELIRLQFNVHGFSFLPKQPVRSLLSGRRSSKLRGRGLDFEEIRRYIPGDDIRTMDWRVTARTRRPHIRVYTEERDRPVLLVVDQRVSMFFGSQSAMKSVTAARVAAMGAWRIIHTGDRVGTLVFNDEDIREVSPHRSRQRVMAILKHIVEMNHMLRVDGESRSDPAMLNLVLEKVQHLAKHDFLICLISDFDGADEATRRAVTRMAAHNDVVAIFIHDPLEARLPNLGKIIVSQGDLQLEVDTADSRLRQRFSDQFEDRLQNAKNLMLKRGIPVLPIHTAGSIREQLMALLGHGQMKVGISSR